MTKITQIYFCLLLTILNISHVFSQHQHYLDSLNLKELYRYTDEATYLVQLNNGDSETASMQLDTPIHFYSESYDLIYVSL